jgi:hypothetical protein
MYHSIKGFLSGAILTGLLLLASEPVDASGYTIVLPTEITNLHADVTHIMVTARGIHPDVGFVSLGVGFAAVDSDRNVNESISISMDSVPGSNLFAAESMMIGIYPCNAPPIPVNSPDRQVLYDSNQLSGGGNCTRANDLWPFSVIDGWNRSHGFQFSISDLSP